MGVEDVEGEGEGDVSNSVYSSERICIDLHNRRGSETHALMGSHRVRCR